MSVYLTQHLQRKSVTLLPQGNMQSVSDIPKMIDLNVRRIKPAVERHWFQRQGTAVSLSVDRLAPSFNLSTIYLLAGFGWSDLQPVSSFSLFDL